MKTLPVCISDEQGAETMASTFRGSAVNAQNASQKGPNHLLHSMMQGVEYCITILRHQARVAVAHILVRTALVCTEALAVWSPSA